MGARTYNTEDSLEWMVQPQGLRSCVGGDYQSGELTPRGLKRTLPFNL